MIKTTLCLLAAVGAVFCFISRHQAMASDSTPANRIPAKTTEEIQEVKLNSKLRSLLTRIEDMGVTRNNVREFKPEELSTPLVKFDNSGNVQTYVWVDQVDQEKLARLEEVGAFIEIVNSKYKIAQAWVPFEKLQEVADLEFVMQVTSPDYGKTRTGSVTTEGDAILGSDDVRDLLGFDGTGALVGVISDGVRGLAVSQATGDLPDDIIIGSAGNGSEGRALLEIIHDIAPGAGLAFSSGLTSVSFINSINFLRNTGADVIVDDLGFLGEAFFADGPIAGEAAEAVDDGVIFISSAGNDADQHYQASYVDGGAIAENILNAHDFGLAEGDGSDTAMRVSIPPQQTVIFVLQWNDRFGQSSNDYDLYLFDPATGDVIDAGTDLQNGNDNPVESAGVINDGSSFAQVDIVINRFSGQSKTLEIFFNGPVIPQEFNVARDSIWGHPAVPGVIAVGAVPSGNPSSIEDYSSRGPVTIAFPPDTRPKPDVVAPDGISTSVDGFDPFFGTSASAPHVAGVVALMLDKNPNLTSTGAWESFDLNAEVSERQEDIPADVLDILASTAIDLGQPEFDNTFGFGRVNAFEAVESITEGDNGGQDGDGEGNNESSSCSLAAGSRASNVLSLSNLAIILIPSFLIVLGRAYRRKRFN